MALPQVQLLRSFDRARLVNEVYWNHTEGDEKGRRVSVMNLWKAVEKIIDLPIHRLFVDAGGDFLRGLTERYPDRVEIYVSLNQPEPWQRFTFVKELCHALCDGEEEFSTDGLTTLRALTKTLDINGATPVVRAESFAEVIAVELLYPWEFRRKDKELGTPPSSLAEEFGIPARWIEASLTDNYLDTCDLLWGLIRHPEHER